MKKLTKDAEAILIERFGKDMMIQEIKDDTFTIALSIELSPIFYGWLFQWTPQIEVLSPMDVKEQYQTMLSTALEKYK